MKVLQIFSRVIGKSKLRNSKYRGIATPLISVKSPRHYRILRRSDQTQKRNGAARLDPWEIFLLLVLKIPFHFISLRKLENYLQFYMTIAFKLDDQKKVHHKFEIAFNFKKEIPLKCFLSPLEDTLSPLGIVHFI